MSDAEQQTRALEQRHIETSLDELLEYARSRGFVVEVTLEPQKPLAMGHYVMRSHVRVGRGRS